jgi:ferredoxin
MSILNIDKKECVHCGACTAVCTDGALYMQAEDWTLVFDKLICTHCNACIKACPLRAINEASPI